MSKVEYFLTPQEEQEIVQAIKTAELNTSGEIKVHIEKHTDKQPLERAQEVFFSLNMENTIARNGVLFYVGVKDKTFAIIGDEGINNVVAPDFWESTKNIVIDNFKNANYKLGLINGILKAGEQLKHFFPFESHDTNELSNEISKS